MKKINNTIRYSLNDLLKFEDSQYNSYINREIELGNLKEVVKEDKITKPLRKVTNAGHDYEVKRVIDEIYVYLKDRISLKDFNTLKQESRMYQLDATYEIKNNKLTLFNNDDKIIEEKEFNSKEEAKAYAESHTYRFFNPKMINKLVKKLEDKNYLEKYEIISFAGSEFNTESAESLYKELKEAIKKKPKIIIQATLFNKELNFMGIADMLVLKNDIYEVWDIKRANVPKAKFVVQICAYSDILQDLQILPEKGRILLGGKVEKDTFISTNYEEFNLQEYFSYYLYLKNKFFNFHHNNQKVKPKPKDLAGTYKSLAEEELKGTIESIPNIDNNDILILKDQDIHTIDDLNNKEIHTLPESHLNRLREQASLTESYKILKQFKGEPGNLTELDDFKIYDIYIDAKYTDTLDKEGFVCFYSLYTVTETGEEIHEYFYAKNKYSENVVASKFLKRLKELSQKSIRNSKEEYDRLDDKGLIFCYNDGVYDLLTQVSSEYGLFELSFLQKKRNNNRIKFLQEFIINSVVLNTQEYTMENVSDLLEFDLHNLSLGFEAPIISLLSSQTEYEFKMKEESEQMLKDLSFEKLCFLKKIHDWMLNLRDNNSVQFVPEENRLVYKNIKESIEESIKKQEEQERKKEEEKQDLETSIDLYYKKLASIEEKDKEKTEKELEKLEKKLEDVIAKRDEEKIKHDNDIRNQEDLDAKEKLYRFNSYTYDKLSEKEKVLVLINQLRRFHTRESSEAKERLLKLKTSPLKELLLDMDCIANMKKVEEVNVEFKKKDNSVKAKTIKYRFPPQDFRIDESTSVMLVKNNNIVGSVVDIGSTHISIRYTKAPLIKGVDKMANISIVKNEISSVTSWHISNEISKLFSSLKKDKPYLNLNPALYDLLLKNLPNNLSGDLYKDEDCKENKLVPKIVDVVGQMDQTTLIIQGPPGTGKSYTAKEVIKDILKKEPFARIGISSNSHKAIDNLLFSVNEMAKKFNCQVMKDMEIKKYKKNKEYLKRGILCYRDTEVMKKIDKNHKDPEYAEIIAGTVYALRAKAMDYLFVDEAGQVALANIVAMGARARNIILIGDQNQLPQPTQASHPGESGLSSLEYYLDNVKKVDNKQGFFLGMTRRMNKELTSVVSKYFYESALYSENELNPKFHTVLKSPIYKEKGLQFIPVNHISRTKYSIEEVDRVSELVDEILNNYKIKTLDDNGDYTSFRKITKEDIIIVSPFNMQVLKLKERLPDCKVGTVDKFQGQEAPIVIYSLAASEPSSKRGMDFILNPNRMNVALSRGKALSFVVGSEELISNKVETVEELKLLNMISEIFQMK